MKLPTEQDLLKSARTYDLTSLGAIYDLYSPGIYRYAMRLLGDDCLAEDCVADTFERFLKALSFNRGPKDYLQAYLYRIAHNWITDAYRRHPPLPIELDESIRSSEQEYPEEQVEAILIMHQVRLALRALTPDQRQVVILHFIEGWENDEIGKTLGKPIGAIKALQHRAIRTLRKLLLHVEKESSYEIKK
jgi:RNA polymerase sigma-70 factor (ECF subfamily)